MIIYVFMAVAYQEETDIEKIAVPLFLRTSCFISTHCSVLCNNLHVGYKRF